MEILNLKDSVEKDSFFRKLPNLAEQLPRQIVLKKVTLKLSYAIWDFKSFTKCSCILFIVVLQFLPLLASSLEFGSAAAPALTALLKMGSWLSTEEFSLKVLISVFAFYCIAFIDYALFVQSLSSALDTFLLFWRVVFFYLLGTADNSETVCFQWPSYASWSPTAYWSIWRVFTSKYCWWTSMSELNNSVSHYQEFSSLVCFFFPSNI